MYGNKLESLREEGLKVLHTLSEEDRDNAEVLYNIQMKYLLSLGGIIGEFASERLAKAIYLGLNYTDLDSGDILRKINIVDSKIKEKDMPVIKENEETTLSKYFDMSIDEARESIEQKNNESQKRREEHSSQLTSFLCDTIQKLLSDGPNKNEEVSEKLSEESPKQEEEKPKKKDLKLNSKKPLDNSNTGMEL